MEGNIIPEKQDMVDRKAAWIERMFDRLFTAMQKNMTATVLILSLGLNFYQYTLKNEVDALRLAEYAKSKEEMILEVRRSVQRELPKQLAPYQAQQDSNSKKLDTSLINLNGTVESVKQYFNKNKRK
ncbi:hypothetical protein [Pedobacter gandavensis]|uniref:S-adenosyl-methyltransferase n=1 Tax=Pedobacter gandavensis TaxID=2679963 RepID=A0ABR6EU41_9SPHI|nr:hypothetical protein [Pedobacter gandavensis]MBB2148779.1 hypothetical protein [Pedobacter gandavensis]